MFISETEDRFLPLSYISPCCPLRLWWHRCCCRASCYAAVAWQQTPCITATWRLQRHTKNLCREKLIEKLKCHWQKEVHLSQRLCLFLLEYSYSESGQRCTPNWHTWVISCTPGHYCPHVAVLLSPAVFSLLIQHRVTAAICHHTTLTPSWVSLIHTVFHCVN